MADNMAIDDGMTEAERHFFASGGDVNDALAAEHGMPADTPLVPLGRVVAPPAPVEPAAPTAPVVPAAAAPAAPATPPADDDPGDEIVPGQRNPRRVSWAKFQASEEARLAVERQLNDQAVNRARIEERLSILQQALADEPAAGTQQPAKPERPDPAKDIFAYTEWLEQQLTEVAGKVNGYEQQIQTGQAEMADERRYFDSLNNYAGEQPHFMAAYTHLLNHRKAELMADRYPQMTVEQLMQARPPADVQQILLEEERSIYKNAFSAATPRDPAADIYRMAQLRGWRAPAATGTPAGNGVATPNGAAAPQPTQPGAPARPGTPLAAAPATPAPAQPAVSNGAAPTATDLVESIRRGQSAALSLSNASGGTGIELTPEALGNMTDEQFEAVFNELQARGDKTKLRQLMGH